MKTLLLAALAWISKIPGSVIDEIFDTASDIVRGSDSRADGVSGWEKLRSTVDYLVAALPEGERYKRVGSVVVTIVVNVALLILRMKGPWK